MTMQVDGKRIRALRLERSWSQGLLAEESRLSLRTIQRMENAGIASLQSLRAVADALDVPASRLRPALDALAGDSGRARSRRLPIDEALAAVKPASNSVRFKTAAAVALAILVLGSGAFYWASRPDQEAESAEPQIATIGYGDVENAIPALGSLRPANIVPVGMRATGVLADIYVEVGDNVEAGQLLAAIDAEDQMLRVESSQLSLQMLRNQIPQHELALEIAANNLRRLESPSDSRIPIEHEIESARDAWLRARTDLDNLQIRIQQSETGLLREQVQLSYSEIRAPLSGTVISIDAKTGTMLNGSREDVALMQIADLSNMTVEVEIPEAAIAAIRAGAGIYFTTNSSGEPRWTGTLRKIDPIPNTRNNTVGYRGLIDVDNADSTLYWGLTANVSFVTARAENVLTVPVAALTITETPEGSLTTVEVVMADSTTETREITIGAMDSSQAEVVSGLTEGERVIGAPDRS